MKLLCIGDSITLGLGAGGSAFPALLARAREDVDVRVAAINGSRVEQHVALLPTYLEYAPDVAIVFLGTVDAIPVPRRDGPVDLVRLLPHRYRQPGWLQPRPYLPRRWWKRNLYAIPESYLRVRVNRALIRLLGAAAPTAVSDMRRQLAALVDALVRGGAHVIVCGLGPIDGALFPGAEQTFPVYRDVMCEVARTAGASFVDVASLFANAPHHGDGLLLLDNMHPNARGHEAIAGALLPVVRAALEGR